MDTTIPQTPAPRPLVIIRGKGTPHETRTTTTIPVYWHAASGQWMTIPQKED